MSRTQTRERFSVGDRIGDYIVDRELAFDEKATMFLARHAVLPRNAAVKLMHGGELYERANAVQMLREACLVEALGHPGIPRVFECGMLTDKRPWTAFEHVDGTSIGETIADGPMAVADVVVLVRDVADILDHIHRRGIVHRRLTAAAIVRAPQRRFPVCIRQWGEACTLDTEASGAVDPLDDVADLGGVAFRALTGALPDARDTAHDRYPGAPFDVAKLIDAMLAPQRSARPSSAEVRDRARWLGETLELLPATDKPRWTPPHGLDPDVIPTGLDDADPFKIRIAGSRTRTRG